MFTDALNAFGGPLFRWGMASVRDFLLSIGWPGLIALFAGGVLLVTLGMRTFRFLESPKGIVTTAIVLVGGLSFLRWTAGSKPTLPEAPALASPLQASPAASPLLASKLKETPKPILASKVTPERPERRPSPALELPSMPAFEPEPVASPVVAAAPVVHLAPIVVARKAPTHHTPGHAAPKSATQTHTGRSAAVPRSTASGTARHAGGTLPAGIGGQAPHLATQPHHAAHNRQDQWAAFDAWMNSQMPHAMGSSHMGAMPHMGGMGHPGAAHHAGHR